VIFKGVIFATAILASVIVAAVTLVVSVGRRVFVAVVFGLILLLWFLV